MKLIIKQQLKHKFFFLVFMFILVSGYAQNGKGVFIGNLASQMPPHMSAALEVYANDKGFLIPRMDSIQRLAITPAASDNRASGLMVYDTDNKCVYVWRKGIAVNPTECWFSLCNGGIAGPQGPQGDTGVAGPIGPTGLDGAPGTGLLYEWHNDSLCVRVDTLNSPFTCYWLGYSFEWSVTGDSLIMMNGTDTIIGNLRGPEGPQGPIGVAGPQGPGLIYEWHADSLCVRVDTLDSPFTCYWLGYNFEWSITGDSLILINGQDTIVNNLRGPEGPQGPIGVAGPQGPGLIYEWHADSLCVRVDTIGSPFTCYWLGYNFEWSVTGDSLILINGQDTIINNLRGPEGPVGIQGPIGNSIEYYWNATELCVRVAGDPTYTCVNLVGPTGPQGLPGVNGSNGVDGPQGPQGPIGPTGADGPQGPQGADGPQGVDGPQGPSGNDGNSIEYYWNATELCVRVVGDLTYTCVNLAGPSGPQGLPGVNGSNGVDGPQGPQGPQGPAGPAGPQGPQGNEGPQGDVGPVGCNNANFLIKNDGTVAICSEIYEDDFQKVGIGTNAPNAKLDVNGDVALRAKTLAQLTADVNNFFVDDKSFIRLSSDALRNISGLTNGSDGKILIITNVGVNNVNLQHQNMSSLVPNQFMFSTAADILLPPNHSITLIYDAVSTCWRDISFR